MSFSVKATLEEVRAEIARLQKLEKALVDASGESGTQPQSRVSETGMVVIKLAARLRHLRARLKANSKNVELRAKVTQIEQELTEAKEAMAKLKAERRAAGGR